MDSWVSSQSAFLVPFFIIFLVSVEVPGSFCGYNFYASCSNQLNCGDITNVGYPFWGDERPDGCGNPKLKLTCKENIPTIEMMQMKYRVLGFNKNSHTLRIAREDYLSGICSPEFVNTTLDSELFDYSGGYVNITLFYGCPSVSVIPILNSCTIKGLTATGVSMQLGASGPGLCAKSVVVPVLQAPDGDFTTNGSIIEDAIKKGFEVKWKEDTAACGACTASQGVCGYDLFTNQTTCYCPDQSMKSSCPPPSATPKAPPSKSGNSNGVSLGVGIGIGGAGIVGIFLGWWIFSIRQRRKKRAQESKSKELLAPPPGKGTSITSSNFSRSTPSYPSSKVDLEKGSTYFGAHIFSYEELEEATNNFDRSKQLGDGGFGSVYYGLLRDGREVAVKRLYENNVKRVEQFMNEVEILSGLRHQNLVTLYGCTTKRSQELILVYEYICNGTVADHLNGTRSSSSLMTWPIRLSIALESADALAYLHASKCIHRDVKTNNILLDEHFRVKVADFGLSRLFPTNVTHVSTAPQGTPGYVDPEYYQCYQLTDKSDVYSFGVVMIELISSLPAVDTNRHRHDINLANMAINKIQNHALHELVDPSLGFESDQYTKRTVTSVAELAFRCLQQERDMRPRMGEVVEVLRDIVNEEIGAQKAEVVDIAADDIGLLKNIPPPLSPDSAVNEKWVSCSTTPSSSSA